MEELEIEEADGVKRALVQTAPDDEVGAQKNPNDGDDPDTAARWVSRLRAVEAAGAEGVEAVGGEELPEVPENIREAARLAPDHWLGVVDPYWQGTDEPPAWAIVGQWRTDGEGEVVEWSENPDYRPSPLALGWDDPTDALDAAIQLAATGYGPEEDIDRLLLTAEVAVLVDAQDAPVTASAPDGTPVVPVFTSQAQLDRVGALRHRRVRVEDLLPEVPFGHELYLNPTGAVAYVADHMTLLAGGGYGPEDGEGAEEGYGAEDGE
ncbi:type VII secretion system-associated protein [Streptomyces sp. NPDC017673]|uniref:type VII secretion system-associated protein n=1 Tax=unclassified Streptomyces TaxID=2593676 RepID=UPI0037B5DDC6